MGARQFSDEAAARFRERGNMPASDVPDLERAYDYLLSSWMGRNGVAGTSSYNQGFSRRFTVNGGHSGKRWASVVQSIPQWRRADASGDDPIRGWDWTHRTDRGSSPRSDLLRPTLPGRRIAKYVYDFVAADHERLAAALRRFTAARVVVSYYDHPDLEKLYPGWTQRKIEVSKAMASQGSRTANDVRAMEVLLMNGPSHADSCGRLF